MSGLVKTSDPVRQMIQLINDLKQINNPSEENIEKIEVIIDQLENIVCQIDCAVDFCKLGGMVEIKRFLVR